jgi:hypothetical protein
METSGRANGKAPLCLGENMTPKGRDRLTDACVDGKPTQIFGCNDIDRDMIGLQKNLEEPVEFKLIFVRDNIQFWRFSISIQIRSCVLDCGRIWEKKRRTMLCCGTRKETVCDCLSRNT